MSLGGALALTGVLTLVASAVFFVVLGTKHWITACVFGVGMVALGAAPWLEVTR